MSIIVQKYGGTSVGDLERIKNVARRVIATRQAGNKVVVVLSAMAGQTDRLISMAKEINPKPQPRELDVLLTTGEQVTVALFAMAVAAMGYEAKSFLGFQARIFTDQVFGRARITDIEIEPVVKELDQDRIVTVAGFQGLNQAGELTTLGRGGSDTTAVALAAALKADVCEIYTDVKGVYTTDPNVVPQARKLDRVSYDEMLEMASLGAKVLETRSVEFAKKFGVPVHVRSSFSNEEGTLVVEKDSGMEKVLVSGVVYNKNQARVTVKGVPDQPGVAAKIFVPLSAEGISVDVIVQNASEEGLTDLSFTVTKDDLPQTEVITRKLIEEIGARDVGVNSNVAKVGVIGVGMINHPGVAATMFEALSREGININMITTSEIKIGVVIDEKYTELAVRTLHEAFHLDKAPREES